MFRCRVCARKAYGEKAAIGRENPGSTAGLPRKTDQPCAKQAELYATPTDNASGPPLPVQLDGVPARRLELAVLPVTFDTRSPEQATGRVARGPGPGHALPAPRSWRPVFLPESS